MNWQNSPHWQAQGLNWNKFQYAQAFNQMSYQNSAPVVNGFNGWNAHINHQRNISQNNARAARNPNYHGNRWQQQVPAIDVSSSHINAQTSNNQSLQSHAPKNKKNRKRKFQQQQSHSQQAQTSCKRTEEADKFKRLKFDEAESETPKHKPFMSIADAPASMSYEEKLSHVIWNNFKENRQSEDRFRKKCVVRDTLSSILDYLGKNLVHAVGSTMNGFGSEKSDLDMCLHLTSKEEELSKRMTQSLLMSIQRALQASRLFYDVQFIPARVPILKFRDRASGIECDLNVNNTAGIHNTRLLALYCRFDWRVRPLGMFVKHWGRLCDIHDASRGRLSSYAFNLMLIQYLQNGCTPPVLPSLQKDYQQLFKKCGSVHVLDMSLKDLEPVMAHWRANNPANAMSLGELFIGFIKYFNFNINFSEHALSVRLGHPIPVSVAIQQMPPEEVNKILRGNYNYKIFIEEPFTLLNASRSPYEESIFAIVLRAFKKTHRLLKQRKEICDVGPV